MNVSEVGAKGSAQVKQLATALLQKAENMQAMEGFVAKQEQAVDAFVRAVTSPNTEVNYQVKVGSDVLGELISLIPEQFRSIFAGIKNPAAEIKAALKGGKGEASMKITSEGKTVIGMTSEVSEEFYKAYGEAAKTILKEMSDVKTIDKIADVAAEPKRIIPGSRFILEDVSAMLQGQKEMGSPLHNVGKAGEKKVPSTEELANMLNARKATRLSPNAQEAFDDAVKKAVAEAAEGLSRSKGKVKKTPKASKKQTDNTLPPLPKDIKGNPAGY